MAKHNRKERKRDKRFVKIDYYILKTDAWSELRPREVMVWLLLCQRHNGANNGKIGLSIRDAAKYGKMATSSASNAIKKLIKLGFIKKTREGSFSQKQNYASEFALTHVKVGDTLPTKEFARWKSEKKTVPKQEQRGVDLGAMTNENVV